MTEAERFPGLPPALRYHPLMRSRKTGTCAVMKGTILLTFLFTDIPGCVWSAADRKAAAEAFTKSLQPLLRDSRNYGVPLKIKTQFLTSRVGQGVTMSNHGPWVEKALKAAGLPSTKEVQRHLAKATGADSAAVCFCVNGPGRSFAVSGASEYIVLYESNALFHEFCHLYGASDFYYPEKLAQLTQRVYPNSIMLSSSFENPRVDGITAYLIGWTDALPRREQDFLRELEAIPLSHFTEEREKEYTTGDVANFRTRHGVYTGHMVDGVPHGKGKYHYDSGVFYEGEFQSGWYHGQGLFMDKEKNRTIGTYVKGKLEGEAKIIFANGDRFQGMFRRDVREGFGTMMWTSGDRYSGEYQNGTRTGYGTYSFPSGDRYEGQFLDGQLHGKGELRYANGNCYVGEFRKDAKWGKGTMTWSDGSCYIGEFVNDQRSGEGTYYFPNKSTYVGQFLDGRKHGYGTYTFPDGSKKTGRWDKDKFIG